MGRRVPGLWFVVTSLDLSFLGFHTNFESGQADGLIQIAAVVGCNPSTELYVFVKISVTEKGRVGHQTPGTAINDAEFFRKEKQIIYGKNQHILKTGTDLGGRCVSKPIIVEY